MAMIPYIDKFRDGVPPLGGTLLGEGWVAVMHSSESLGCLAISFGCVVMHSAISDPCALALLCSVSNHRFPAERPPVQC